MAASERDNVSLPLSGVVAAILLVAGAVFVSQPPFAPSRPEDPDATEAPAIRAADVRARLWQDPLAAAVHHRDAIRKSGGTDEHCQEGRAACHRPGVLHDAIDRATSRVVLLLVPVSGGPYAEDAEHRRRMRYAVLSGLAVAGYLPDDASHIAYVELPPEARPYQGEILPYEWFEKPSIDGGPGQRLLLVWSGAQAAGPRPLERLSAIVGWVDGQCGPDRPSRLDVKVLGPTGSDALVALRREVQTLEREQRDGSPTSQCARDATVLSYAATAWTADELSSIAVKLASGPLQIRALRTIATDHQLAASLVAELRLRGLHPSQDHVVLLSEWDSLYGQNFRDALSDAFCYCDDAACPGPSERQACAARIHSFSYLRGLDGRIPSSPSPTADGGQKKDEDTRRKERDAPLPERSDGDGQFDYLRRLADQLAGFEWARRGARLAVGVVGTDVYDKLLVLQALRPRLPSALFFTTDLDARLLHPRELSWTRNVVVASSFGLHLHPDRQKHIPPFRDVYQSAAFFATSLAVTPQQCADVYDPVPAELLQKCLDRALQPRVFEISRTSVFDLTPGPPAGAGDPLFPPVHGSASQFAPRPPLVPLALAVAAAIPLALAASGRVRRLIGRTVSVIRDRPRVLATAVLAGLLVTATIWAIVAEGDRGEPFLLMDGISIWPTQILRGLAAGLAIAFSIRVWLDLDSLTRDLTARFFPEEIAALPRRRLRLRHLWSRRRWRVVLKWVYADRRRIPSTAATLPVERLWRRFLFQSSPVGRLVRIVPLGAVFWVLCWAAIFVFGAPHVPYRGAMSWGVNVVLMMAIYVPSFVFLLFSVVDATRLCDRFTRALSLPGASEWPASTRATFHDETGIAEDGDAIRRWIDVSFIATWTARLNTMIYYPFVVMLIVLLARSTVFDNWDMPGGLMLVFAASLVYAIGNAVILHRVARRGRQVVLDRLTDALLKVKGDPNALKLGAEQIALMIQEVRSIDHGAFAPLAQQPVFKAALLPVGGAGGVVLIEYLLRLL